MIILLAATLALEAADLGTVAAIAPALKQSLHLDNTDIGLLAAVVLAVGAIATIPMGMLTDRLKRTRLLSVTMVLWAAAMVASGAATSFGDLLIARLFLGIVVASAGPAVASLTGDFFAAGERGRVYGYILAGQLIGTGVGFLLVGNVVTILSWRWAFWLLVVPGLVLAWYMWHLPEPKRGGQSSLSVEADRPTGATVARLVMSARIPPSPQVVLDRYPAKMPLREAIMYVLRVRTNLVLIIASALGYFFFAGLQTFAVLFVRGHYGLGQSAATLLVPVIGVAALVGVLFGGRLADALIRRGILAGRIWVGGIGYIVASAIFLPALLGRSLGFSLPLYMGAALALGAVNPPIDAARLDIIHHRLWGRAEGVNSVLRAAGQAGAPLLFGVISDLIGGVRGLEITFILMLIPLAASGVTLLYARQTYPHDVAAVAASPGGRPGQSPDGTPA